MHLDFESKAAEYEKIQTQLEKNLDFLEQFYIDMQKAMNDKWAQIKVEKDAWEQEKADIKEIHKIDAEIIALNVGGSKHIQTELEVLQSVEGSKLSNLFSEMHALKKVNDEVFIDRDGKTFETLINYLRNDRKVFPEFDSRNDENMFYKEVHYWGIDSHNKKWQENHLKKLDKSLINDRDLKYLDGPSTSPGRMPTPMEYRKQPTVYEKPPKIPTPPAEEPSYMQQSLQQPQQTAYPPDDSMITEADEEYDEEIPGVALKAVKAKW